MIGLEPQKCLTAGYYNFQHSVHLKDFFTRFQNRSYCLKYVVLKNRKLSSNFERVPILVGHSVNAPLWSFFNDGRKFDWC